MQSPAGKMNVPLQLKQITQHTTQVAFSTSFLLGGCVAAGREDETPETFDVDAGEDVIIESVQYDRSEAASHAYHAPDAPVVMPLELEDAPTSLPPSAALSPPREPKEKRSKQTQSRTRTPAETEAGEPGEEDGAVVYSYELTAPRAPVRSETRTEAKSEPARPAARRAEKPVRDPVAESFLHTYGGSGSYQTPATGTRY
jgi:hypothetical protein